MGAGAPELASSKHADAHFAAPVEHGFENRVDMLRPDALQIGVDKQQHVSLSGLNADRHRPALSRVAGQFDHSNPFDRLRNRRRVVRARVVHNDNLIGKRRAADGFQHGSNASPFIESRNDDCDHRTF